jgi:hypothetical protein
MGWMHVSCFAATWELETQHEQEAERMWAILSDNFQLLLIQDATLLRYQVSPRENISYV